MFVLKDDGELGARTLGKRVEFARGQVNMVECRLEVYGRRGLGFVPAMTVQADGQDKL